MSKIPYELKLKAIRNFTDFKFKRKRKHFTASEKAQITRYYNYAEKHNIIKFNEEENKFYINYKINKKAKAPKGFKKFKGLPEPEITYTERRTKGFKKIYIPFSLPSINLIEIDDKELKFEIEQELHSVLGPYYDDLNKTDFFTVVLANGREIGQKKARKTPKEKWVEGNSIGGAESPARKIRLLTEIILENVSWNTHNYGSYKEFLGPHESLVQAIILWKITKEKKRKSKKAKK